MTSTNMTNCTTLKLLRNASASACEPASTGVSGSCGCGWEWESWFIAIASGSFAGTVGQRALQPEGLEHVLVQNQRGAFAERVLERVQAKQKIREVGIFLEHGEILGRFGVALRLNPQRLAR